MNNAGQPPPQLRSRGFRLRDGAALAVLAGLAVWLGWRVLVDFNYDWQWGGIPRSLVYVGEDGEWRFGTLARGLGLTLRLSLWASALGLVLGLVLAMGRLSGRLYCQLLARTVVEVNRNLPPLVLIFVAFYFLSAQLLPWARLISLIQGLGPTVQTVAEATATSLRDLGVFFPAALALALYEAAYFSEIFRGAILAAGRGQWEAAHCLGLSRWQQYRFVILPQAFRRAGPQLAGQFISTVKDSSIVSVVSLAELTYSGQQLSTTTHRLFEAWLTVAALYFLVNFGLSTFFRRLEN